MDANLLKICDANLALVKQNRFGLAITQAKSYLLYILGENRMDQINKELDEFVDYMRRLYQEHMKTSTPVNQNT